MSDEERVAEILGAWRERRDRGEGAEPEEVIREHPDLAEALRPKFKALAEMEEALGEQDASSDADALLPAPGEVEDRNRSAGETKHGTTHWALDTPADREAASRVVSSSSQGAGGPLPFPESNVVATSDAAEEGVLPSAAVTRDLERAGLLPVWPRRPSAEGAHARELRLVRVQCTLADAIEELDDAELEERLALLDPFERLCDTVGVAHEHGIVHGDLEPASVVLGEAGEVVVLDWDLAFLPDRPDAAVELRRERLQLLREAKDLRTLARSGTTPAYMPPEAFEDGSDPADTRGDVYALGAVLYQVVTGLPPFAFQTLDELRRKSAAGAPTPAHALDDAVPVELSSLCARCLAHDASERPANAAELAAALRAWQVERQAREADAAALAEARRVVGLARDYGGEGAAERIAGAAATCRALLERTPDDEATRALLEEAESLRKTLDASKKERHREHERELKEVKHRLSERQREAAQHTRDAERKARRRGVLAALAVAAAAVLAVTLLTRAEPHSPGLRARRPDLPPHMRVEARKPVLRVVPNVVGMSSGQARTVLGAAGFGVSVVYLEAQGADLVGRVLLQSPPGQTRMAAGAAVELTVGRAALAPRPPRPAPRPPPPPPPRRPGAVPVIVPHLAGWTQEEAAELLDRLGLVMEVETVEIEEPGRVPGTVLHVTPEPGTTVHRGHRVKIRVGVAPRR